MGDGIDEAGRYYETFRVDSPATLQLFHGDGGDSPIQDADVANSVELRFRIDDAPAVDHKIVIIRPRQNGGDGKACACLKELSASHRWGLASMRSCMRTHLSVTCRSTVFKNSKSCSMLPSARVTAPLPVFEML